MNVGFQDFVFFSEFFVHFEGVLDDVVQGSVFDKDWRANTAKSIQIAVI